MLYGTIEGNIELVTNEDNDTIKLISERNNNTMIELTLEDDRYNTKQLAHELLGMAMQLIYELEDEESMIKSIQSELTDNYDTSKKEYRIEVK